MGRYRLGRQHQLFQNLLEVANEVAPLILDLQIDVTICTFLGEPKATQVGISQDIPRYPKIHQEYQAHPNTFIKATAATAATGTCIAWTC